MKLKKEYAILLLVIVALAAYLFLRTDDQTSYEIPRLDAVENNQINRLVVTKNQKRIELRKADEQWVVGPKAYAADSIKVSNMVRSAAGLTLTALVSESKSYERYGLGEEQKLHVEAFAGKEKVRDFFVGRRAPTQQHTFVTLAGNPNVYHARGSIDVTFGHTIDELRDETVLKFEKSDIVVVTLNRGDQSATFTRKEKVKEEKEASADSKAAEAPGPEFEWVDSDGNPVKTADVDRLIAHFADLKCDDYLADDAKEGLKAPLWTVTLKSDQSTHYLSLYDKENQESIEFPAAASGSAYAFILHKTRVENFEKSIDKLLPAKSPATENQAKKGS
ncbi:MAG: DUF4340 domain-containing protein [Desulfobacteraceae bacterium]